MKFNLQEFGKTRNNQFSKLGLWYILALSSIASIIIIGQILIQNHLSDQLSGCSARESLSFHCS
jgi:hypothetical protein